MFRFVVICGCLVAVANAAFINGVPVGIVQPTLSLRPGVATASSSSNIVRGIAPLGAIIGGRNLVSGQQGLTISGQQGLAISGQQGLAISGQQGLTFNGQQGLTTLLSPSGLDGGLAVNGYGIDRSGSQFVGYL